MPCIEPLYNHYPYFRNSAEGVRAAMIKRAIIGTIFSAAIAVGIYFAAMALYNVWNPFQYTVATQMGLTITTSVSLGLVGCAYTFGWARAAKTPVQGAPSSP